MTKLSKQKVSELASLGVDIGRNVFHLVGFDADGKIVVPREIKRLSLVAPFKVMPRCIVATVSLHAVKLFLLSPERL